MERLLHDLPKVELHVHIEGTMEPELFFRLAERNGIHVRFASVEALRQAYENITDLQSFLQLFEEESEVLVTSDDFFELAWAYFQRAAADNVRHCEIFVNVQSHLHRGVPLERQFQGVLRACRQAARELRLTVGILLGFSRDESEQAALDVLQQALAYREHFVGIGLEANEVGHPPSKFARLYAKARELGLHCVAHAGEEGPASYVQEAMDILNVERIDHGVHCVDDPVLVKRIAECRVPITLCPLSNLKLKVVRAIADLPLKTLLDQGVRVTINSDDPAYFGGYILANFQAVQEAFHLSVDDWARLTRNAIDGAFLSNERRQELRQELQTTLENH